MGIEDKLGILRASESKNLPLIYNVKDRTGRFQFITEISARHTGASSSDELINRTAYDMQCEAADYADDLTQYERMTMEERSETLLLSLIQSAQGAMVSLICNKPVINEKGVVEGVETWAQILPNTTNPHAIIQCYQADNSVKPKNSLLSNVSLTRREQECVFYLAKGFTFLEMGRQLLISPRTVETHVNNIKKKLNVKTRAELIMKVCEMGYLQINAVDPHWQPGKLQLLNVKPCEQSAEILT